MAKPIFLVSIPIDNFEELKFIEKELVERFDDYHVLCVGRTPELKFEVFYEKDFDEVKFDELKKIVMERMYK